MDVCDTRREAERKAEELVKDLKDSIGGDWEPDVSENLGWHYRAKLGTMSVSFSKYNTNEPYSCGINDSEKYGGALAFWDGFHSATTPAESVRIALRYARQSVKEMENIIVKNEELLNLEG